MTNDIIAMGNDQKKLLRLVKAVEDYGTANDALDAYKAFIDKYEIPRSEMRKLGRMVLDACESILDGREEREKAINKQIAKIEAQSYDYLDAPDDAAVNGKVAELVLKIGNDSYKNQAALSAYANTRTGAAAIARLAQSERYADLIPQKVKEDCIEKMKSLRQIRFEEEQGDKIFKLNQKSINETRYGFRLATRVKSFKKFCEVDVFEEADDE